MALSACGGGAAKVGDAGTDLGVILTGTRLAAGDLDVEGVTTDGYVAAFDWSRGALAVPLTGGAATLIDATADSVGVFGNAIVVFRDWDSVAGIGDIGLWTAAAGTHPFAQASSGLLAMSDDSTRILATAGSSDDGTATNLVVGGTDGAPPIVAVAASRAQSCRTRGAFAAGKFIATHCDPGSTFVKVSSIDPATGAVTDVLADAKNLFVVLQGFVAVVRSNGDGFLIPMGGGPMMPIGHEVDALVATPDRTAVLVRSQGAISRIDTDGRAPVTLVANGAQNIWDISPDGAAILFRKNLGPRHSYGDLLATSAIAPSPPLTLSTALNATTFGSAFTNDSRRVLYITDANDLFVGTLQARLVSGDGDVSTYGERVWATRAYSATRVVFTSDYVAVPERSGLAVLRAVDTASEGAQPSIIATSVRAGYALTPARDAVVFSFNDGSDRAGLYLATLPGASAADTSASSDAGDGPSEIAADAGLDALDAPSTTDAMNEESPDDSGAVGADAADAEASAATEADGDGDATVDGDAAD